MRNAAEVVQLNATATFGVRPKTVAAKLLTSLEHYCVRKLREFIGVRCQHRRALTDPTKITTLVVWTSNDIYDVWRASPARAAAMSGAEALWSKPPESERFEVAGT